MNYIEPRELSRMIKESQAQGTLTRELVGAVERIAEGYLRRWPMAAGCIPEDAVQHALCSLMRVLSRIDPEQAPFAYITTILANSFKREQGDWQKQRENLERYARYRLGKVGRHVLEVRA